jgi:hypothetical protein
MATENTPTPDSKTTPVPASNERADPGKPDPVADLQVGGLVEQVLGRSRMALRGSANQLHEELAGDLKKMRGALKSPGYYLPLPRDVTPDRAPTLIVVLQGEQYRTDAVLRFCLGRRWHIKDDDGSLRTDALEAYQGRVNDYDQVLGDFIPEEFRRQGHAIAAEARFDDGTNRTAADDWPVYCERLRRRRGRPLLGLPTGLPPLDRALRGLRGLTFLGGGAGVGKSTLALFIAAHALRSDPDLGVLFYSLDMPKTVLYDRLLSQESGVEYGELMGDTAAAGIDDRLSEAEGRLHSELLPRLRIAERLAVGERQTTADAMIDDLAELMSSVPLRDVLIIVDYFQLLPVPDEITAALDADSYRVKSLQRVQGCGRSTGSPVGFPILAISEVRKGESGRAEISIGDLMGSARLAYSAESVLLLELTAGPAEGPVVPVQLKVAKARDGAARVRIELLFEHTRSRFREAPGPGRKKEAGTPRKGTKASKREGAKLDPLTGLEG